MSNKTINKYLRLVTFTNEGIEADKEFCFKIGKELYNLTECRTTREDGTKVYNYTMYCPIGSNIAFDSAEALIQDVEKNTGKSVSQMKCYVKVYKSFRSEPALFKKIVSIHTADDISNLITMFARYNKKVGENNEIDWKQYCFHPFEFGDTTVKLYEIPDTTTRRAVITAIKKVTGICQQSVDDNIKVMEKVNSTVRTILQLIVEGKVKYEEVAEVKETLSRALEVITSFMKPAGKKMKKAS